MVVAVKLPGIMSGSIMFENILSIRVLSKFKGINELDTSKTKNSLAGLCSL